MSETATYCSDAFPRPDRCGALGVPKCTRESPSTGDAETSMADATIAQTHLCRDFLCRGFAWNLRIKVLSCLGPALLPHDRRRRQLWLRLRLLEPVDDPRLLTQVEVTRRSRLGRRRARLETPKVPTSSGRPDSIPLVVCEVGRKISADTHTRRDW